MIVDDDAYTRSALHAWLEMSFPACMLRESESGEAAVRMALESPPSVVLMDIQLPGINGISATSLIKSAVPNANVVMLSNYNASAYKAAASQAGACGYVLKSRIHSELMPLLRTLL